MIRIPQELSALQYSCAVQNVNGGGVSVNSVSYSDATHATLNLSVGSGALNGARTLTIINPDGQMATSAAGILTIIGGSTNQFPTISRIENVTIDEDTTASGIAFQVMDLETTANNLTLSADSSNT